MIKVSAESWHCRLLDFKDKFFGNYAGYTRPKTLCSYFWSVVFAPITIALVWGLYTSVYLFGIAEDERGNPSLKHKPAFWTMLITTLVMFYLVIPAMCSLWTSEIYEALMVISTGVILLICIIVIYEKSKKIYSYNDSKPKGESFTGLSIQMAKAAKRRVCPLIEYND